MNGKSFVRWMMALGLIVGLWAHPAEAQNNPPVVSNVTAAQRGDGSKLVDVTYDLDDADGDSATVWAVVSDNAGVTFRVPAFTFSGDVGSSIAPGNGKQIVWDAGADIAGTILTSAVVRVYADDGNGPAPMVVVEGGYFEMGDSFGEGDAAVRRRCQRRWHGQPIGFRLRPGSIRVSGRHWRSQLRHGGPER